MWNLVKMGTDLGVGAAAGVLDQVIGEADARREAASATPIGFGKLYSTYYNYGLPILAVIGTGMNVIKGDMATRLVTIGGQLAGRQATARISHYTMVKTPAQWSRAAADRAAAAAQREASGRDASRYNVQNANEILV